MASTQGYADRIVGAPPAYSPISPHHTPQLSRGAGERPSRHETGLGYPQSEENQPLLGAQARRFSPRKPNSAFPPVTFRFLLLCFTIVLLPLIVGWGCGYTYAYDPASKICDPSERNRIRKEWDLESFTRRQEITKLLHEKDVMQHEWMVEHDNLMEFRRDVEQEYQRWEQQREQWDKERRQWREERKKHEEEERERERRLIQWGPLQKDQECVSYGAARYQAHLQYVPPGWDQYTACTETPIQIHQKDVLPTQCQFNTEGQVVGVWVIDFEEPACKPWWRDIKDHGCTSRSSGIHRYETHLEAYLEPNEFKANWAEMCNTTPHSMFGRTYNSPTECKYWPEIGVYGFWDIQDGWCL